MPCCGCGGDNIDDEDEYSQAEVQPLSSSGHASTYEEGATTTAEPASAPKEADDDEFEAMMLVLGGSVLIKHGDMNGEELLYSTRLTAELTSFNAKSMPLDEIISIDRQASNTIGIRTLERVHKLDAKNEHVASLWTKAITDAMSIRHYTQNDLPQLQQGTKLTKQGTLMKREVNFKLSQDGNAFDYDSKLIPLPECKSLDQGTSNTFTIITTKTKHTFVAPNSAVKGQWMELIRAAMDSHKAIAVWERVKRECRENPRTIDFAAEAADSFGSLMESTLGSPSMKDTVGKAKSWANSMMGKISDQVGGFGDIMGMGDDDDDDDDGDFGSGDDV